ATDRDGTPKPSPRQLSNTRSNSPRSDVIGWRSPLRNRLKCISNSFPGTVPTDATPRGRGVARGESQRACTSAALRRAGGRARATASRCQEQAPGREIVTCAGPGRGAGYPVAPGFWSQPGLPTGGSRRPVLTAGTPPSARAAESRSHGLRLLSKDFVDPDP